ncbi:hypothetical protein HX109_15260 [Galbibacter sp. BG1]|uniref:hypothetical protein n=1 Tax=Galbibacter sp. BG1 TaxID=1170699 RepID=UPI0015BA8D6B|nr:hypothetical protein [Galbibacter sp. BG1]QLE02858.1 hypothetical protein HX109_15260 [Galbibacter sp. BG1]
MKKNDNIDDLFKGLRDQWDVEEPSPNHEHRFLEKLNAQKETKSLPEKKFGNTWKILSVAASLAILLIVGIKFFGTSSTVSNTTAEEPTEVQKTQFYFASLINEEMEKIQAESTPETKQIVADAMLQMKKLKLDYEKLEKDLANDGNSKQILHAMIINFQTRINLLQDVLDQMEEFKKLNTSNNENQII